MDPSDLPYYGRRDNFVDPYGAYIRSADAYHEGIQGGFETHGSPRISRTRAEHMRQHFEIEKQAAALGKPPLGRAERRCHRCYTNVPIRSSHCWGCGIILPHGPSRKRSKSSNDPRSKANSENSLDMEPDSFQLNSLSVLNQETLETKPESIPDTVSVNQTAEVVKVEEPTTSTRGRLRAPRMRLDQGATDADIAALDDQDFSPPSSDEGKPRSRPSRRSNVRRYNGSSGYDGPPKKHTQKACPSCGEIQGVAAKFCRECEYAFPIGLRRAAKEATVPVTRESLRFEVEFDEDGLPKLEKILARRLIGTGSSKANGGKYVPATSTVLLKFSHRVGEDGLDVPHTRYDYEYLVKYKGVSYKNLQWLTASDIEARGKTARTALNRLIKKEEARLLAFPTEEDEEYFDPAYCEVERVLDVRYFDEEVEVNEDEYEKQLQSVASKKPNITFESISKASGYPPITDRIQLFPLIRNPTLSTEPFSGRKPIAPKTELLLAPSMKPAMQSTFVNDAISLMTSLSQANQKYEDKMDECNPAVTLQLNENNTENETNTLDGLEDSSRATKAQVREEQIWRPFTRCMKVLEKLEENSFVEIFLNPVNTKMFPKYLDVVETPMDLGTIREKLKNWQYRRNVPDDFARDVRLVWHNCKVFNKHGSAIWYTADYMAKHFERLYSAWVTNFYDKTLPYENPLARPWEQSCRVCLSDEENVETVGELLLCDCCDAEYHTKCLDPPLDSIPLELWQCPRCQSRLAAGGMLHSHALEEVARARAERDDEANDFVLKKTVKVKKYLVKWRGLSYRDCTWETKESINDDEAIEKYHRLNDVPPVEPSLTRDELWRELNPRMFNQLPAVRNPDMISEMDSQIYAQLRTLHYLRFNQIPSNELLKECGWATTQYAYEVMAIENEEESEMNDVSNFAKMEVADVKNSCASEEDEKIREEVKKVIYDAVHLVARGSAHSPDYGPLLPCEYEVTVPKINNSLFMNIAEESGKVRVDTFRQLPDGSDPPVRIGGKVQPLHYIVAINGEPCDKSGFEATINKLRTAPTYVTLRLCADLNLRNRMAAEREAKIKGTMLLEAAAAARKAPQPVAPLWPHTLPRNEAPKDPVSDSDSEDEREKQPLPNLRKLMETMGSKRKLLLAITEVSEAPCEEDSAYDLYRPGENGQILVNASTIRTKPIEQIDVRTGEIVRVWNSMTAAHRHLGISLSSISSCIRGRTDHAGGYRWRQSTVEAVVAWQKEQAAKKSLALANAAAVTFKGVKIRSDIQQHGCADTGADIDTDRNAVIALKRLAINAIDDVGGAMVVDREEEEDLPWQALLPKAGRSFKGNELRDYQQEGVRWMLSCWYRKRSCILADEMGLGKTVQVTAVLEHIFSVDNIRGPFLVAVPLSTIEHWRREIEGWTDMELCVYHDIGGGREMRDAIREYEWYYKGRSRNVIKFHILLTTYDDMIRDFEELSEIPWRCVVVDEAHRLRNMNSRLLECLRSVMSRGNAMHDFQLRILMTGTPLQNNMEELWSLMNFIQPDKFADRIKFLEKYGAMETEEQVRSLQNRIAPHMLRRVKEDVASDIPPKEETVVDVELTLLQKQYYRAIFEKNHSILYKVSSSSTSGSSSIPSLMNIQMELRKCCNHPYLVRGVEDHEVAQMLAALQAAKGKAGEAELARERLQKGLVQSSGKMVLLDKLLAKLKKEDHKVLLFSQFISMLDIISEYCTLSSIPHERLDGRITGNERQRAIDRFNRDPNSFLFLLSTRAGGVGINLTAADVCIIFDSDWNPQNDVQAMARCHRIGQTKKVAIYRLITRGSFESEMFARASRKLGLEQAVLGNSAQKNDKMTTAELELLLREGAYAMLEGDEAMEEFNAMDIDSILQQRTRVITTVEDTRDKRTADWLSKKGVDAAALEDDEISSKVRQRRRNLVRKQKFSTESNADNVVEVDDPLFWQKVMPDLVTPLTILARLEEGEPAESRAAAKSFMIDVEKMVSGINVSRAKGTHDFNELQIALKALTQIVGSVEMFTLEQREAASEMLMNLEGSRLRKANRFDAGHDDGSDSGRVSLRRDKANEDITFTTTRRRSGVSKGSKVIFSPSSSSHAARDFNMDICCICEEGGQIILCDGPCNRSFHAPCLQLQTIPGGGQWVCPDCKQNVHECLICGVAGSSRAGKPESVVYKCSLPACGRYYHIACLREDGRARFLPEKQGSNGSTISFKCPQHYCRLCNKSSAEISTKSTIVKCIRCPNGYHESCVKRTTFIRKGKMIICEDHIVETQINRDSSKEVGSLSCRASDSSCVIVPTSQSTSKTSGKVYERTENVEPDKQFPEDFQFTSTSKEPKCKFCKRTNDDEDSVEGPLIRPPFIDVHQGKEVPLWAHKACVLYSPDCYMEQIENDDGTCTSKYYNVLRARRNGRCIRCSGCDTVGATIDCYVDECKNSYHFKCALSTGWAFSDDPSSDGKAFRCPSHRGDYVSYSAADESDSQAEKANSVSHRKRSHSSMSKGRYMPESNLLRSNLSNLKITVPRTCICGSEDGFEDSSNTLKCRYCKSLFHASCLGVNRKKMSSNTAKSWRCEECARAKAALGEKGMKSKRKSEPPSEKSQQESESAIKFKTLYSPDRKLKSIFSNLSVTIARETARKIISELRVRDTDDIFEHPVSDSAAPDYSKFVARPMCLSLINENVSRGRYDPPPTGLGICALAVDLDLIFSNCLHYNEENSPFNLLARSIQSELPSIFEDVVVKLGAAQNASKKDEAKAEATYDPELDTQDDAPAGAASTTDEFKLLPSFARMDLTVQRRAYFALLRTLRNKDENQYFETPVAEDEAPGYTDEIERPMCWETIDERIERNIYRNRSMGGRGFCALIQDIRLVYLNAMQYNAVGDSIYLEAEDGLKKLPGRVGEVLAAIKKKYGLHVKPTTAKESAAPPKSSSKLKNSSFPESAEDSTIFSLLSALGVAETKALAKQIVSELRAMDAHGVYESAIEELPVKRKMSLRMMDDRARKGLYTPCSRWNGISALLTDTKLIFANTIASNPEESAICKAAREHLSRLPGLFARLANVFREGLPSELERTPKKQKKKAGIEATVGVAPSPNEGKSDEDRDELSEASSPSFGGESRRLPQQELGIKDARSLLSSLDPNALEQVGRRVVQLLRDSEEGEWFEHQVTDAVAPGYSDFIRKPMWLCLIEEKLTKGRYRKKGGAELLADLQLIFRNAMAYNMEDSEVYLAAAEAERLLPSIVQSAYSSVCGTSSKKRLRKTTRKLAVGDNMSNLLSYPGPVKEAKSQNGRSIRQDQPPSKGVSSDGSLRTGEGDEEEADGVEDEVDAEVGLKRSRDNVDGLLGSLSPSHRPRSSKRSRKAPASFDS